LGKQDYILRVRKDLKQGIRYNKKSIESLAKGYGITNKNLVKEFTELAIVLNAREIAHDSSLTTYEKYLDIVAVYNSQVNLSMRTSMSVLMQQYSTPAPISFLASSYILRNESLSGYKAFKNIVKGGRGKIVGNAHVHPDYRTNQPVYFEPSAGNGLLTIALPYSQTYVNELDDVRLDNLMEQPFAKITNQDATQPFFDYIHKFDGVVTNPPFGTLSEPINFDKFKIKRLEHAMCLRALQCMKNSGRAALIIGGHTTWDEHGRVTAGQNRIFLNYLYHFYNVDDIILINGKKLYSRQGTSFDVRLILIDGAKDKPDGAAPLKNRLLSTVVSNHDELWDRVGLSRGYSSSARNPKSIAKIRAKAILIKQKQHLFKKVGVSSGTGKFNNFINRICFPNQKPVWFNVAFKKSCIVAFQRVWVIFFRQIAIGSKHINNCLKKFNRVASFYDTFVVFFKCTGIGYRVTHSSSSCLKRSSTSFALKTLPFSISLKACKVSSLGECSTSTELCSRANFSMYKRNSLALLSLSFIFKVIVHITF
jgi:hypothetical protein